MALFTDGDFVQSPDMIAIDAEVVTVMRAETAGGAIMIDGPSGLAAQAVADVGQQLLNETQSFTGYMPPFAQPYNQTAAVLNMVGPSVNRSRIGLSQVVTSSPNPTETSAVAFSALKRYAVYRALELFYRTAFYRKNGDRYEKKFLLYGEEIRKKYWPRFYNLGCPIVFKPLAAPGALHEFNAGTWDQTRLSAVAGTNANENAFYDVAITWVDNTKYQSPVSKGNAESAPSAVEDIQIPSNTVLQVDITPLNAPNGLAPLNVALGQGLVVPGLASGWNIYAGAQGGILYLQNPSPIPIAQKIYALPGAPVLNGYAVDTGQYPEEFQTMQRMVMRG